MNQLTTQQQAAIKQFLNETVLASASVAQEYLEFYEWDSALALDNYFADYAPR